MFGKAELIKRRRRVRVRAHGKIDIFHTHVVVMEIEFKFEGVASVMAKNDVIMTILG